MMKKIITILVLVAVMTGVSQAATVEELRTPNVAGLNVNQQELEALQFLYAYMPLADVTDYTVQFHLENVRATFAAREQMPWGTTVPELLFKHFVLPLRVNNEALDMSRPVFFEELKERVKGMSMAEAILEVNHWCHEHVTYQPSDARTLSPLACMKTAIGRCGEESTFTVAALRSIGIPARQVYTPRWAHTDDNHAWVEAWADGQWHFMGACEPEAVLDLGWFNAPASRAMLMHTRAFGNYNGPEEVMSCTRNFTEINLIGNYAATASTRVRVLDQQGKPVKGATVQFCIYNYGEFYPAATKVADDKGIATLTAGKGDMLVWASKDGWYGYRKVTFGKDGKIDVTLNRNNKETGPTLDEIDIVPPVEHATMPMVTAEMAAANKVRFAREDSIRKAYESTFITPEKAQALFPSAADYLIKARGNWETILEFVKHHPYNPTRALGVLKGLNDKDMRDVSMAVLEDAYNARSNQLGQRVEYEMITSPFKMELQDAFDAATAEIFRRDPSQLVAWVQGNIELRPEENALHIAQTPMGVWRSRVADERGRNIFFVDLARSLDIESQMDPVTGKVQYRTSGDEWQDVNFETVEQQNAATGTLVLRYTPTPTLDDPKYYHHFTLSRILDNGTAKLLNYDEGDSGLEDGSSWSNTFQNGTTLDAGTYLLTSGTRAASGKVLAANRIFTINPGQTTTIDLTMRQSDDIVAVIGNFNSESKFILLDNELKPVGGDDVSILSQTGRGYFIVGLLGVGQEPTNHAMRDIAKKSGALDKWGRPMVLLFENEQEAQSYRQENFGKLPKNVIYGIDRDGSIRRQIGIEMKLQNETQLPIFILADTFNRVAFSSQGYTIGLGEQLTKVINNLDK